MNTNDDKVDIKIKPNKWSYILFGGFGVSFLLILLFILIISYLIFGLMFQILIAIILVFFILFCVYLLVLVCYKKEEYIFTNKKIIYNYGNIFSDNTVEINLDKIVQVHTILGFIQNSIFKTGTILIRTAGSSGSKMILRNIDIPMEVYEMIQRRMRLNGFHLKKDKLVQTAKPHWLGVFLEVFSKMFSIALVIFIFFGDLIFSGEIFSFAGAELYIFAGTLIIIGLILIFSVITYFDLNRRRYDVFTDSVYYTEGFLTKNYSFLPMESVADTENRQGFVSKILGLHDVIVSSEGADNKVIFKNMLDGEQMMKNIKYLKNSIIKAEKNEYIEDIKTKEKDIIGFKDELEKPLDYDKSFKADYKMDMTKAIVITLPFLLLPILFGIPFGIFIIFIIIAQIIRVSFTKYTVGESSIDYRYEFLSNKHNSFSVEKISGVIIRESFIDKWFKTCSITFWSIGSNSDITFSGIKKTKDLEENILAKIGIRKNEKFKDIKVKYDFLTFFNANLILVLTFALVAMAGLIMMLFNLHLAIIFLLILVVGFFVFYLFIYLYQNIFYKKHRYIQRLYDNFVESISGIFFIKKYYSLYRHIKSVRSKRYPFTEVGTLVLDIAGEQKIQSGNNGQTQIVSNSINITYLEEIDNLHEEIDNILNEEKIDKAKLKTSKQEIANSVFGISIFLLIINIPLFFVDKYIFIGTLVLSLIIIIWVVWIIKVKYFVFEKNRAVYNYGIIYKSKHTILYDKINFIEKNEGFLNKIFKNGTVQIYTLGSSKVEMRLNNMNNYIEIYNLLKKD